MDTLSTKLFVYGTLMRGYGNNCYLSNAKFINKAQTKNLYSLHVLGGIPLLHDDEELYHIHGEVYAVNNNILANIDELEGNGEWYNRRQEIIYCDEIVMNAWIYFNNEVGIRLKDGNFVDIY